MDKLKDTPEELAAQINEELGESDLKAYAAAVPPSISLLVQLYAAAPDEETRYWIARGVESAIPGILQSASALTAFGPAVPTGEIQSLAETMEGALEAMESDGIDLGLTGSILGASREIAEILDRAVKAVLITANNDQYFNREALLDLLRAHAMVVAALIGLDTVPTCFDPDSEQEDESDGSSRVTH